MDWRSMGLLYLHGALALLAPKASYAQLALPGYSGLISNPNAAVLPQGLVSVNFSWLNGSQTYLFAPNTNRIYMVTTGILPGLETTLRQTQVIGWHDPDVPGDKHAFDRMFSAKYRLPMPEQIPKVAIGVQDLASVNFLAEATNVKLGMTQHDRTTLYGVITNSHDSWN